MTPPKKWPEHCENARMDSITLARESFQVIEQLFDMVHGDDVLRLLHKVSTNCLTIEKQLTVIRGRDLNKIIKDYLDDQIEENEKKK